MRPNRPKVKTSHQELLDAALGYAARGLRVIPLHNVGKDGRCSCGKDCGDSKGKHPRTAHGLNDGTTDADTIRRWWTRWPAANVGVCTGAESGLWMLGPDGAQGLADLDALQDEHTELPATPTAKSGSGGRHFLFRWPAEGTIGNQKKHRGTEIDFRGTGGYFVAAPSRNGTGPYRWEIGLDDCPLPEAPPWLLGWCRLPNAKKKDSFRLKAGAGEDRATRAIKYLAEACPAVSGDGGHDATFWAARCVVYGFDLGVEWGYQILAQHYNPRCRPEWTEKELRHKCDEADSKPFDKPRGWLLKDSATGWGANSTPATENDEPHLTDLGNAQRIRRRHGEDMRFCHAWRQFLVWDGKRFAVDDTGEAVRRAKDTQAAFYLQAAETLAELAKDTDSDPKERKAKAAQLTTALKHALRWEDSHRINASLELLRSDVPIRPAEMDKDIWLLNVSNGTIDLHTGQLRPHCREDLLTKLVPVAFDPEATCPLWMRCLATWMNGKSTLTDYLRRVIGHALTGDVSEQTLFFLHGDGRNGKSTFLNVIREMLGDYACQAVPELLTVKTHEAHPTERKDLFGRRFVATVETEDGKRMAESLMKQLTGGENLKARGMRENFFEMAPTWKLFLASNHKPVIRGVDFAVWRRIRLIPFMVTIKDEEKDKDLPAKLRDEFPGILAWAVRGCLEWQRDGLGDPDEVKQATAEYRREQDAVAEFIAECCVVADYASVRASVLLETYQKWSGDKNITRPAFRNRLNDKGFRSERGTGGGYYYRGIGLPSPATE
jgi:putative DNA primase/helicase